MAVFEKKPMLIAIYNHSQLLGLLTQVLYKRGVELTEFDIRRSDCRWVLFKSFNLHSQVQKQSGEASR